MATGRRRIFARLARALAWIGFAAWDLLHDVETNQPTSDVRLRENKFRQRGQHVAIGDDGYSSV